MTGEEAFQDCLASARAGDPSAWVTLYDDIAPLLHGYLRHQSLDDPDDVAGEVLLQVVRDVDGFDGSARQFRSWALAIAHHRMLDARRARIRRPADPRPAEDLPQQAGPDATLEPVLAGAEWGRVGELLSRLTDDQREVVVLRVVNELTLEETARVLGRSVGSVKALQHRAFHALRAHLANARNPTTVPDAHEAWPS
jgi:RNA polymerase sigma factor (sigma-70 family)